MVQKPHPECRSSSDEVYAPYGILQRDGAWELIPRPDSLPELENAFSQVNPDDFQLERQRVREHRRRFRLHTRSQKQSRTQLNLLEKRGPPFIHQIAVSKLCATA
jgi:hypothetical protein